MIVKAEEKMEEQKPKGKKKEIDPATLTHTLQGTAEVRGQYHLIAVKYNPETMEMGEPEFIKADGRYDVNDKFKLYAIDVKNVV